MPCITMRLINPLGRDAVRRGSGEKNRENLDTTKIAASMQSRQEISNHIIATVAIKSNYEG